MVITRLQQFEEEQINNQTENHTSFLEHGHPCKKIKHASHLEYPGSHNDYKKELCFAKAQIQLSKYAPASLSEIC